MLELSFFMFFFAILINKKSNIPEALNTFNMGRRLKRTSEERNEPVYGQINTLEGQGINWIARDICLGTYGKIPKRISKFEI